MVEIKINDGSLEKLSIAGDTSSISADMTCAIRLVYEAMKEHDKSRADAYKRNVTIAVEKGFAFDADVDEVTEMLHKKMKDSIKDLLDNMFNRRDNT